MFYEKPYRDTFAKLVNPDLGYDHHKEMVKQLNKDTLYKVEGISMGQSSTSIKLEGFKPPFNSIQFEFLDADNNILDIYNMPEYNPYMRFRGKQS